MSKRKAPKSWADEIADLDDPAPKDLDPEHEGDDPKNGDASSSASDGGDSAEAREHYVDAGMSKLRKFNDIALGPEYTGLRISRDDLLAAESDGDPFASGASDHDEEEDIKYADPEEEIEGQEVDDDEEIDSNEAFGEGDDDKFEKFTFRGSKAPATILGGQALQEVEGVDRRPTADDSEEDEDMELPMNGKNKENSAGAESGAESDSNSDQSETSNDSNPTSDSDSDSPKPSSNRAELRNLMSTSQKTVLSTLSLAAKSDIAKGRAIKQQRTTFDSLLNMRIRLQKALIATNTLPTIATTTSSSEDHKPVSTNLDQPDPVLAAERAALSLWTTLSTLRHSLHPSPSPSKKPRLSPSPTTPTSTLWSAMQSLDTVSIPTHRATLTKWSQKVHLSTTLPAARNALSASATSTHQPLTSILDQHLSAPSSTRLLARARIPRSCAPVQVSTRPLPPSCAEIYDDADFYTSLLRELVDQRMSSSSTQGPPTTILPSSLPKQLQRETKQHRVGLDTKASKGRKMRYTVHEKLQNFMAPVDLGTWGERQVGELFGGLLGQRGVQMGEDIEADAGEGGEGDGMEDVNAERLVLFGR